MTVVWVLLIAGLLLIVAELFLPGMVAGIIGAACLVGSVILCFVKKDAVFGSVYFGAVIVLTVAVVALGMKYFPRSPFGRKMVLKAESPDSNELAWLVALKGHRGTAHTVLRPAGTAMIGDKRVDVVAEGAMIPRGSQVEVISVEGNRVVVRKV